MSLATQGLAEVPAWLGKLTALTTLDLNHNQLTEVPASLGNLTALTTLDLNHNQLTEVPAPQPRPRFPIQHPPLWHQ